MVAACVVKPHALTDRRLPTPRRRRRVGNHNSSDCTITETDQDGCGVVEIERSSHLCGRCLNAVDLTAHHPQQVDLVDQIDQEWTRCSGASPLGHVVAARLSHGDHRVGGNQPTEVVSDRSRRRFDQVVVAAMMPDEQLDSGVCCDRTQVLAGTDGVGNWLFDEKVDPVASEERSDFEMRRGSASQRSRRRLPARPVRDSRRVGPRRADRPTATHLRRGRTPRPARRRAPVAPTSAWRRPIAPVPTIPSRTGSMCSSRAQSMAGTF